MSVRRGRTIFGKWGERGRLAAAVMECFYTGLFERPPTIKPLALSRSKRLLA
jgi:hypothetical protein